MADIIFRYQEMADAVSAIRGYQEEYIQAAEDFKANMKIATDEWEGTSKESFMELVNGSVYTRIHETIPNIVKAIADTLESNAAQMKDADQQIASSIPSNV